MTPFAQRRARALAAFAGGAAIIPSARSLLRNSDTEHEFRQNSDFYYLTGFDEPDAVLVLTPESADAKTTLFLRERDRAREVWDGHRVGVERACATLGVDRAYPIDKLDEELAKLVRGVDTLFYGLGDDVLMDARVHAAVAAAKHATRKRGKAPHSFTDPALHLHRMRQVKSADEIATLRRSATATARGHLAAMRATKPGVHEYEIEAVLESAFRAGGAQRLAYESIVAGGDNATVLHYITNRDALVDGTLLLIDAAAELDYYATDVTRTWPVNGHFSAEQRAVYEIVLAAQQAGIDAVKPGHPQDAFHTRAVRVITEGLIAIGVLSGNVDENVERETYREYYMHGTGHWLGMDVHDVGPYANGDEAIRFEPGMVTTVEPGLYFRHFRRDSAGDERFKGIGVRIEDDILVTTDGNQNLTLAVPKRIDEVEATIGCA